MRIWVWAFVLFIGGAVFAPLRAGGDADRDVADEKPNLAWIEHAFQNVVDQVAPSVVGIRVQRRYMASLSDEDDAGIYEQMVTVNGSGTVMDRNGLILTNEHVVQSAEEIEILFHDRSTMKARVWAADPRGDLAVLKVDRDDLVPVKIADWSIVARGQWSITLGNPYGIGADGNLSVSIGVISNLDRTLPGLGEVDDRFYADMIQTTAPIHPGCSGGPLFNIRGELVGVVTAMHTRAPADEGVGFAIPMTKARRRLIHELTEGRQVEYGYLGLTVRSATSEERDLAGLDAPLGAVIQQIDPAGPTGAIGLREGDMVLRFQDQDVSGPGSLAELVGQTPPGRRVKIELRRNLISLIVHPLVQRREISHVSWMRGGAVLWRGMRLTDLNSIVRRRMEVSAAASGVAVIDVIAGSPADRAEIQIGDIVESVGKELVGDVASFDAHVRAAHGPVKVRIRARGEVVINP